MDLGRGGAALRIAYGRIFHEANAYSPLPTTREDFERFHHVTGAALAASTTLRGEELPGYLSHAELTGFCQAARLAGGVETVPLASSLAVPSGPLEPATFDWLLDELVGRIREAGRLDGIYLALHGSMQVAGLSGAPEAEILARVRRAAGEAVRIAVTYDLHANLSEGMVAPADVLIAYRTNPHWDLAPAGFRAGNRLVRLLRGRCRPVHAWRKLPMVLGGGTTISFLAPMRAVFSEMKRVERSRAVLGASLFMVHPYTSAEKLGWAVHVMTDGDAALAGELAERLAETAWSVRRVPPPPFRTVEQALDDAAASPWRRLGPVTLVDVDDVVGAGAPGGNTRIAGALLSSRHGLRAYVPLHDPAVVAAAWDATEGKTASFVLRGTPGYGQPEVVLDAAPGKKVTTEFGRTVRLDAGTLTLAVTERSPLPVHPKFWRALDRDPRRADVIVQKNFFHYRMFYATTSFAHVPVVSDGATSLVRVRERAGEQEIPTFPAKEPEGWRAYDPLLRGIVPP